MVHTSTAHEVLTAVFQVGDLETRRPRLKVLLWQRAREPQSGRWSLPGGLLRHDEDVTASARRQLAEKVDLREIAHLEQLAVFSDPARVPGVRTIASMNGPWEHIMVPHLNISMPNIAFPITEETVKKVRDSGSELWLYNCGDERLNLGLYPWRVKAGGRFQWHYRYINADPWDDLDGAGADTQYCLSLPGPDGPVPAVKSQMVREAVDDHRYIATLEQAIAAARSDAKKQAAVAKATRFLEELRARVPVDFRTLVGYQVDPRAAGASVGGEFKNTDALDRVRWAVAQLILELQTAGGGATTGKGK